MTELHDIQEVFEFYNKSKREMKENNQIYRLLF